MWPNIELTKSGTHKKGSKTMKEEAAKQSAALTRDVHIQYRNKNA
jgi:hypothetical protein